LVNRLASAATDTGSGSSPALTTTLAVLGLLSTGSAGGASGVRGGSSSARVRSRTGVGGTDITEADVGVSDGGVSSGGFDVGGLARGGGAGTASDTGLACIGISRVVGVEPEHVDGVVIPNREHEDHATTHGTTNTGHTALLLEAVGVTEGGLLGIAEIGGDGVIGGHARDSGLGVLDDLAVLNVETTDFAECAGGGVVAGKELSDDRELAAGVDGHAFAVEVLDTHTEGVEIATVGVTDTLVAAVNGTVSALAASLTSDLARVGSEGSGDGVGFPNIEFTAAGTVLTSSCVSVVGGRLPASNIGLSIDELDVTRTLRVAVAGTIFGTSLVGGELGHTTIGVHLGEVEGTVKTAREVGDVDVESELLVQELEHLVVSLVGHEVDTRADVLLGGLSDEFEGECVTAGGDTVCARVISTVESAVRSTGFAIRAKTGIPGVAGVAVGVTGGGMEPTPVRVEDNGTAALDRATAGSALRPLELRMGLCCVSADLLPKGSSDK